MIEVEATLPMRAAQHSEPMESAVMIGWRLSRPTFRYSLKNVEYEVLNFMHSMRVSNCQSQFLSAKMSLIFVQHVLGGSEY